MPDEMVENRSKSEQLEAALYDGDNDPKLDRKLLFKMDIRYIWPARCPR